MPLYDRPVRQLMHDMASDVGLKKRDVISRNQVLEWFAQKYPKVKKCTVAAHLLRFSTNAPSRVHYSAKPGQDDLFFQIDGGHFRLYDADADPAPIRAEDAPDSEQLEPPTEPEGGLEFAYEADLRSFLSKNLHILEPGLRLYEDEDIRGIEFPAGGRFIDLLAVDRAGGYVVIELKVSKGYDRVVGQLLRYMAWIKEDLAEPNQAVRGMIVARSISDDLRLASSLAPGIDLFEYELRVAVSKVPRR